MTHKDQALAYVQQKGLTTPSDIHSLGAPPYYLHLLAHEGKIQKLGRGLYAPLDFDFTENQDLLEVCKRTPSARICLLSALRFHNLTTQNPFQVWIAIDNKAWSPQIHHPPVRTVRFSGSALTEGIQKHNIRGGTIHVYSPEKTIADCFKYRNKIGLDVALEALRAWIHHNDFNMNELLHYAQICRVQNVIKPYLEALT